MIEELFSWDGLDDIGTCVFQYYDCELVKQIGNHLPGEMIDCIVVDFEKGYISFGEEKYSLSLILGTENGYSR